MTCANTLAHVDPTQSFHQMCVMYNPYLARDDDDGFECGSEGCPSFGRACRPPRYRLEDLTDTPLGQYMTARSRAAVKNPRDLVIKVVADKDLYKQLPDAAQGVGGTPGREGGFTTCGYRSKCILGFRTFPSSGSQVVFFGMYVHEYGAQSAAPHARRVFVECLDSTPLYSEERPCERQDLLTNIMLAYFEFVTAQGFEHVHIRVPPPTDDKAYIFASRSINIRLRATMHLALWFKRLLQVAKAQGVIDHFAASPNSGMNNTHNFPASLLEPAQLASDMAFRCATGDSRHDLGGGEDAKDLALKDRFFVVVLPRKAGGEGGRGLDPEMVQKWTQHAMLPSAIAGDRMALVSLLQREDLRFHSLAHNNYSTMMLVHHLMEEQQVLGSGRRSQHHHQQLQQRLGGSAGGAAYAHNVHHGPDPHGHAAHPYMAYGHGMMGDARMRGGRMHGGFAGGYMVGDMSLASQHQNPLHCGGEYSPRWTHGSRSGSQAGASPVGGNFGNWYPGAATGPGDFGAGGRSRSTSSATLNRLPECKDGESPCMQSDGAAVGKDDWHRVDGAAQRSASARHGKAQGRAGGRQGAGHSKRGRDGGEREGSATSSDHTRGTGTSESTSNHSGVSGVERCLMALRAWPPVLSMRACACVSRVRVHLRPKKPRKSMVATQRCLARPLLCLRVHAESWLRRRRQRSRRMSIRTRCLTPWPRRTVRIMIFRMKSTSCRCSWNRVRRLWANYSVFICAEKIPELQHIRRKRHLLTACMQGKAWAATSSINAGPTPRRSRMFDTRRRKRA